MNTSARTSKSLLTSTDEFITRYTQAVNTFDVDAVADLFAAGAVFNAPNGRVLRSCVEIRAFFSQLFQAQGTIKVTSAVAQDNQLVLEIGVRARRDASGQLVSDPTAPIRPVAIDHFTFAADGKYPECGLHGSSLGLGRRLGGHLNQPRPYWPLAAGRRLPVARGG